MAAATKSTTKTKRTATTTKKPQRRSSAAKRSATTTTTSKASVKRAEERRHYQQRLRENEARLDSGLTAHDEPMTPVQTETLRRVIEAQRLKLAGLMVGADRETFG